MRSRISPLLVVISIAASVVWPLSASENAPPDRRPGVEELTAFFNTIVFGSEFEGIKASAVVRKWRRPLRVVVREYGEVVTQTSSGREIRRMEAQAVSKRHLGYVQKHLDTLVDLTGLKTQDAQKSGWPANFTINFVPPLQLANPSLADISPGILQRLAGQGGCYFIAWPDQSGESLQKVVIVVNKARPAFKTDHCVLEEMTQSLGLPNDSNPPWPSIFSNTGAQQNLSWVDRILVRALYDPRLIPGMAREKALVLARRIIAEIVENQPK